MHVDHASELAPDEIEPLLISGTGPRASAVAGRHEFRDRLQAAGPPALLGEPEDAPPINVLPPAMARATAALMTMLEADAANASTDPLNGTGIGAAPCIGRARVATDIDDAIERLEPGEVLIAPFAVALESRRAHRA